ncbi:mitotic interactor and substrate of PLK1 [Callospermophilus lateralis]|uniref:mitotic interactor and substrate of PLK1 n=1 Tax=Callospermophilus lateralis TaxID=76772 RepID=UPI0040540EFD
MDRVTRYPIFSIPHSARITGLALDGDTSYTIELVGVGPEDAGWNQDRPQAPSPDHKAQVDMVKTGATHSRQAFPGQWSLRPLCLEDDKDGDMPTHHLGASSVLPRQWQDLEQERGAVIQGQAVRKGGTVATLCGTSDHGNPRPLGHLRSTPLEETRIDREQIDFLAARRQFINLEQANTKMAPPRPPARAAPPCAPPGASPALKAPDRPPLADGSVVPSEPQVRELFREKKGRGWPLGSSIPAVNDPGSRSRVESPEAPKETPIEREIRLAQEREADLREQRGLRRAAGYQELVEIPTRPVLTKVSLAEAPRWDRGRPSLYVQRDMVQETQREEDHRREGLQAARASTPDWASEDPQPGLRRSRSSDSILGPTPDARAADPAPASRKVNRISPEAYQPYLAAQRPQREFSACRSHGRPSGPSAEGVKAPPKAAGSQRQLPESSGKPLSTEQGTLLASEGVVRWDHFRLRPLRFRVPDVPQRAEAPQAGGWEAAGAPVSRLHKSLSSDLLEREVESVLRREREVAAERRSALFPEVFSPPPEEDCEPDSRSSSRASGIVGSYSVSESPVFTPIHLHSGLVWKAEAPAEEAAGQRKKGLWYAGINPADQVNSEILGATRVTRHKNVMAERWEAGIYAIEDED